MLRAVLDTNVLISAFLFYERGGVPVELLSRLKQGRFTLVLCTAMLDELENVLTRDPTVGERYRYSPDMAAAYRAALQVHAELIEPALPILPICRDPDDDVIVATAAAAKADYLVTGDNDLLSLESHGGVRIVTPRDFLGLL